MIKENQTIKQQEKPLVSHLIDALFPLVSPFCIAKGAMSYVGSLAVRTRHPCQEAV